MSKYSCAFTRYWGRRISMVMVTVGGLLLVLGRGVYATEPMPTPTPVAQHYYGTIWDESFFYIPGYTSGATEHQAPTGNSALHGVPTDQASLGSQYDAGIRLKNVYLRWRLFEPTQGQINADYLMEKKEEIRRFREKGFSVVLRINPFPVPEWLFTTSNQPAKRLKNQYGVEWVPEAFGNTPDSMASIWDSNYRTHFQHYLEAVFAELGTNFHAVYLTIGQYGEVAYPIHDYDPNKPGDRPEWKEDYAGNENCYWAWDAAARAHLENRFAGDSELAAIKLFVPATGAGTGERLVNGGFEDHTVNGVAYYYQNLGTIPNWGSAPACLNQGAWSPAVQTSGAQEGTRYLHYSAPSGMEYYLRQEAGVRPNTAYQFSGWVRSVSHTGHIRISTVNTGGTSTVVADLTGTGSAWAQRTHTFTTPADVSKVIVDVAVTVDGGGVGSADFDGFSLMDTANPSASHSVARKFLEWYHQSLAEFANWQIGALKEFFAGPLILMEGGYAGRSGDIETEVNNDLSGGSRNHYWVRRGFVPDRYLAAITNKVNVYFANTAVEQPGRAYGEGVNNNSPLQSDWSAPYYMAFLANRLGFGKWSENSGRNNSAAMADAFNHVDSQDYVGLGWYTAGQLTDNQGHGWANIQDFKNNVTAHGGPAEPAGYYEGFVGTPGQALPGWTQTSGATLLCAVSNDVYVGRLTLSGEGEVLSPLLRDLNVREYFDTLEVKVSQTSTTLKVGVKDKLGRYFWLPGTLSQAGTLAQKIHTFTWDQSAADLSEFRLVLKLAEGALSGTVDCEYVKVVKTERSSNGYQEHFWGSVGQKPAGWQDAFNATMRSDGNTGGILRVGNQQTYGDVTSPIFRNLDLATYDRIEFKLDSISAGTSVTVQLVEVGADGTESNPKDVYNSLRAPGSYRLRMSDFTSQMNLSRFLIKVWIAGTAGSSEAVFDYFRIIPTPGSPAGFADDLTGPANQVPYGWRDSSNSPSNNTSILGDGVTNAVMRVLGNGTYGDVVSPIVYDLDTNQYGAVEFKVSAVSANAYVDLGVQEERGAYRYFGAFGHIDEPGVYRKKLSSFAGTADLSAFSIKHWINGPANQGQITLDYLKIVPVVGVPTLNVSGAYAELFNGAAQELPQGWRDLTTFEENNVIIKQDGNGHAVLKLKNNGAYGDCMSPILLGLNAQTYNTLEIKLDQITTGGWLDIGLQQENGEHAYFTAFSHLDTPGVYRVNLSSVAPGADLSQVSIKFWLNGTANVTTATLDSVRIITPPPVPTVTPTAEGYADSFDGPASFTPEGWRDSLSFGEYNATLRGQGNSTAKLQLLSGATYGDVMSPVVVGLDTANYNVVEIRLNEITSNGWLDIGVQQETGARLYFSAFAHLDKPGVYRVKLNDIAPGADLSQFSLKFWINGTAGATYAVLDSVHVRTMPALPTVTPTTEGYAEHFTGAQYFAPTGWRDKYTYIEDNTSIRGDGVSSAEIRLLDASKTYGDVISPVIVGLNTQTFNTLEIVCTNITANSYVDIGLQEETGAFRYFPALAHVATSGTYSVKLANVASGADLSRFSIKFWLNGPAGTAALTLDSVKVLHAEYGQVVNWTKTSQAYPRWPMAGVSAVGLSNGNVLLSGGVNANNQQPIYSGYLYYPSSQTYSYVGDFNLGLGRAGHTSTLLSNGQVLLAGGTRYGAQLSSAELFTGSGFASPSNMTSARVMHMAVRLQDGRVLLTGGYNNASAEVYNSGGNNFSAVGNMSKARTGHSTTLLDNGKVLVAGGPDNTTELYDPATQSFSAGPSMTSGGGNRALRLPNGKVLVVFGAAVPAELYDPSTNSFTQTGSMSTRSGGFPVLMPNGKVVVAGDGSNTEVYDPATGQFTPATGMPANTGGSVMGLTSQGAFFFPWAGGPYGPTQYGAEVKLQEVIITPTFTTTQTQVPTFTPTSTPTPTASITASATPTPTASTTVSVTPTPTPSASETTTITTTPTATTTVTSTLTRTHTPVASGPVDILYSSFFGGSAEDRVQDMTSDAQGNIYLTGVTRSPNLPVTANAFDPTYNGDEDAFVAKLSPDGRTILYCTYLGGDAQDYTRAIAVDAVGNIYIAGATWSSSLPVTANAYQSARHGERDAFVAKFNTQGQLTYCSYLGGSSWDYGFAITVGNEDEVYVGGFTHGSFPVTTGAAQTTFGGMGDGFVAKMNTGTGALVYSTYLGGKYWEAVSRLKVKDGVVYVAGGTQSPNFPVTANAMDKVNTVWNPNAGGEATLTSISMDGSQFIYSTFIGTDESPKGSEFNDMIFDNDGNLIMVGTVSEVNWPTTNDAGQKTYGGGTNDGVIVKYSPVTNAIVYRSYFGGSGNDGCASIVKDSTGRWWVVGFTDSSDFPAGQSGSGGLDLYAAYFESNGLLLGAKRFGGSQADYVTDGNGMTRAVLCPGTDAVFIGGVTASTNFPVNPDAFQGTYGGGIYDGWVAMLSKPSVFYTPTVTPTPTATPAQVLEFWKYDFDGAAGSESGGGYEAKLVYNGNGEAALVSQALPWTGWGKFLFGQITCNVQQYPMVEVKITSITPGCTWKIGIQERDTINYWDLGPSSNQTGTFQFNYQQVTGWVGTNTFKVQLTIEGASGTSYTLDYVRVGFMPSAATPTFTATPTSTPTQTPTITPTPLPVEGWMDHFDNPGSGQSANWLDERNDAAFNAQINNDGDQGIVTKNQSAPWGKVLSPVLHLDVSTYKYVEVNVTGIHYQGAMWKVGIQEVNGAWQYWNLNSSSNQTGIFSFDLAAVTGWSGMHDFRVQLTTEGYGTYSVDWVRVYRAGSGSPTVTRTATWTPTMTPTPEWTATPTATPQADAWVDEFNGTPGVKPTGWMDEGDDAAFNAHLRYAGDGSYIRLSRSAEDTWGKVLSPVITCDVDTFSAVQLGYRYGLGSTTWKVGVQEVGGAWQYWDLCNSYGGSAPALTFEFNLKEKTGWSGTHSFRVQLVIEGASDRWVEMNWIRVCRPGTVHGASAGSGIGIKAMASSPTYTTTPTPSPTPTITATNTPEATASPTSTPTTGVKVDEGQVIAFPNPARGKVTFAYAASGVTKVKIDIYRLTGERVASIEEPKDGSAQTFTTAWQAAGVAPGVYFCRIVATDAAGKEVLNVKKKVALVR